MATDHDNEHTNPEVLKGEIMDDRTGEIIPKGASQKIVTSNLQVQVNVNTIGTLQLSEQAEKVLAEPLKPEDVKIRPDGLVYLPWSYYARKLDQAFGKLQWGMIPQGAPQSKDTGNNVVLVVWTMWLVVKGIPVSVATGETSYRSNNSSMSYGDAIEGAKSSALARNCKQLGISLELWDPEFVDQWKKQYAHKIPNPTGGRPEQIWVRKDDKRYANKAVAKTTAKPAPKTTAKPAAQTNETLPSENSLPVDEQFPKDEIKAEEISGAFSLTDLRKKENIEAIKAASGADIPTILITLKNLAPDGKYTIKQVTEMMTTGEKQDG